jgi:hypothetical protein
MTVAKLILVSLTLSLGTPAWSCGQGAATVHLLDGKSVKGQLAGVTETGGLAVGAAGGLREIPVSEILAVILQSGGQIRPREGVLVELASGDVLAGVVDDGRLDEVALTCPSVGALRLRLDDIRRITMLEALRPSMMVPRAMPRDDEVYIAAGNRLDRVRGEVVRLDRSSVVIDTASSAGRKFSFKQDAVVAVLLAPLDEYVAPKGVLAVARFRDGSSATGQLTRTAAAPFGLRLAVGPVVTPSLRLLERIDFKNPRFTSLCDLPHQSFEEIPFLEGGQKHGLRKDKGFRGEPRLRIGEVSYFRGLGLHAQSKLTYSLDGTYRKFQALVGADPHTRDRSLPGSVRVRVLVDGKERWKSLLLIAGRGPRKVQVAGLEGARALTLVADFGDSFSIGARAVIADPVLLR